LAAQRVRSQGSMSCSVESECPNLLRLGSESGAGFLHHRQGPLRQAPVTERPVALPPENQGAKRVMPLLFQPSPPPCAKCGTTTVLTPAFEEGQRVFVVRCPACGRAGTYTLDYSALASGEPDHRAASVGGL
jgi:hypothetical protein